MVRQHARAKQELAEHEQLQKLSAEPDPDAGTAAKEQLHACKEIESHSRTLAGTRLSSAAASNGGPNSPAGVRPLRAQRSKAHDGPNAAVLASAQSLCAQIKGSDQLRAYFRACGGLAAATKQLQTAACQSESYESVLAACCQLLTEACSIDTNARHVAGCATGKSAPAAASASALLPALCALAHKHSCVAELLHAIALETDARAAVAGAWAGGADGSTGLAAAVSALPTLTAPHRAQLMALLTNCASVRPFQAALAAALSAPGSEAALLQLLQSDSHPASLQRTAALMTNAAASVAVRKQLAASPATAATLVARALQMLELDTAAAAGAALACLECLHNLTLEINVRAQLVCAEWHAVLSKLLPAPGAPAELDKAAQVALATAARSASCPDAYAALQQAGIVQRIIAVAICTCEALQAAELASQEHIRVLDAAVRALASWGGQGHIENLRATALLRILVWACSAPCIADSCAGNAALCVGFVADERCVPDADTDLDGA